MIAGIDLGGTQVRVVAARSDGRITGERKAKTWSFSGPQPFIAWLADAIAELAAGGKVKSIGIGSPGPLDIARGRIVNPANLPPWCHGLHISELLSKAAGAPVHLGNDADLAGLGEHRQGAGRGARNQVYVTWSTGIGTGLIIEGRLYNGSHGNAGEGGHTVIDPFGPVCNCGQRGCVEAFAGGRSLEKQTGRSAADLFAAAKAGEQEALAVVERAAYMLGIGILNFTNLFDPDVIVVGGGITNSWSLVSRELKRPLLESPFVKRERRPAIKRAALGGRVGIVGAVEWARANL